MKRKRVAAIMLQNWPTRDSVTERDKIAPFTVVRIHLEI